jgi:diguanylate cyclase (GGDEF)-like protein/PAS domain S-box-containing protein
MGQETFHPPHDLTEGIGSPDDLGDRYRLLAELSPDGLVVHQGGLIVYANRAGLALVAARDAALVLDQSITTFVHPDDIGQMLARIKKLEQPGAVSEPAEIRLVALDGSISVVESTSVRTTWQGRPAMQVILRDLRDFKAAETALLHQAALAAMSANVSEGIIAVDRLGLVTSWNPAAEAIYGLSSAEAAGRPVGPLLGPLPPVGQSRQVQHQRGDRQVVTVRVSVSQLRDAHDQCTGAVIVCSDRTAQLRAEQQYAMVVASLEEGIVVTGATGVIESANPSAERLLGQGRNRLVGSVLDRLPMWAEDGTPFTGGNRLNGVAFGRTVQDMVVGMHGKYGEPLWLSVSAQPMVDPGEPPYPVVLSFTDITKRRIAAALLLHDATHDPLTSLANRSVIVRALDDGLAGLQRDEDGLTVVFIDLDHFKAVNDSLGHGIGDEVLRLVAERLRLAAGPHDVVGRLGGDEFIVVSRTTSDVVAATALAARLRSALDEPFRIVDRLLVVGASAGVVVAGRQVGNTAEDLLRDADVAMYQAKEHGRGRHELFDAELRAGAVRRLRLGEDLRMALYTDQFWVAHQPVIEVRSGRVVSTEALLRWDHPDLGSVSPAEFIPVAEESGLILALGLRVLEEACVQTVAWRSAHPRLRDLTVAVNLSARQLADPYLVREVEAVLRRTGLPAGALWFEITESMLMADTDSSVRVLQELRGCGIQLSIDDFGTGYSSLAYLRRFAVDALKIDRSFIMSMQDDAEDAVIVGTVLTLAHGLGLRVVAEGVELQEQLDMLTELGCDEVQGYLTGRPGRAADVLPILLGTPNAAA